MPEFRVSVSFDPDARESDAPSPASGSRSSPRPGPARPADERSDSARSSEDGLSIRVEVGDAYIREMGEE
jgi:hypothetical protein